MYPGEYESFIDEMMDRQDKLIHILDGLLAASGLDCEHEETYKRGASWTVCKKCGKMWEGYEKPKPCKLAQDAIDAIVEYRKD